MQADSNKMKDNLRENACVMLYEYAIWNFLYLFDPCLIDLLQ